MAIMKGVEGPHKHGIFQWEWSSDCEGACYGTRDTENRLALCFVVVSSERGSIGVIHRSLGRLDSL